MSILSRREIDTERGTGRTTRMLNEAISKLLDGFNIIVTAYSNDYALQLQNTCCKVLTSYGISFEATKHIIKIDNNEIVFVRHFEFPKNVLTDCKYIDFYKNYLLFEDHYHYKNY